MVTTAAPIELVLINFPQNKPRGEVISALERLVKDNVIRIIDILLVSKDRSGNVTTSEISNLEGDELKVFQPIVSETQGILSAKDAEALSAEMKNDSSAGLMLFEDTWAQELAQAIDRAGGEVVVNERIPRNVLAQVAANEEQ
jgi:uncharacterized membrane protein